MKADIQLTCRGNGADAIVRINGKLSRRVIIATEWSEGSGSFTGFVIKGGVISEINEPLMDWLSKSQSPPYKRGVRPPPGLSEL